MEKYKNRLKDLREDKDLKQSDIASLFGLHLTQYRRYEAGEVDLPTEWAKKFAKLYFFLTKHLTKTELSYIMIMQSVMLLFVYGEVI